MTKLTEKEFERLDSVLSMAISAAEEAIKLPGGEKRRMMMDLIKFAEDTPFLYEKLTNAVKHADRETRMEATVDLEEYTLLRAKLIELKRDHMINITNNILNNNTNTPNEDERK